MWLSSYRPNAPKLNFTRWNHKSKTNAPAYSCRRVAYLTEVRISAPDSLSHGIQPTATFEQKTANFQAAISLEPGTELNHNRRHGGTLT
jgi:hypothetical protein